MSEELFPVHRVMSVHAHPDDAEFSCSGTLARMAEDGIEVTVVVCTAGNRGGEGDRTEEELTQVREAEQRRGGGEEFFVAVNCSSRPFFGTVEVAGQFEDVTPRLDDKQTAVPALPVLSLDAWGYRIFQRR